MTRRTAPKMALWLLQRLGRGYHTESLIGDLIEQSAQGKGGWWVWRESIMAILFAQARRWRLSTRRRVARVFWWGLTEVAIMLSMVLIADQSQHSHSNKDMVAPTFVVTLMVCLSIACIGLGYLIRLYRRQRERAPLHHLMAVFLVMNLGMGMLTWAATVHPAKVETAPRDDATIAEPTTVALPSR
jgi:hypothetical protein